MSYCSVKSCTKLASTRGWCNTHYCQVIRHGKITNSKPHARNVFRNNEKLQECKTMYDSGMLVTEIAKKIGVNKATVYYNLHRYNLGVRSKSQSKLADKNPMWVGDRVKYGQLHVWVKKRLPKPKVCPVCEKREVLDLANIAHKPNGKTYNRKLENWVWLCRRCHMVKDGRLKKLNQKTVC